MEIIMKVKATFPKKAAKKKPAKKELSPYYGKQLLLPFIGQEAIERVASDPVPSSR